MISIEFDPNKDSANWAKHKLPLAFAAELDWDAALVWEDDRIDYKETRMIALVPHNERIYCAVYVDRVQVRRIISLRRANDREVKFYADNK